MFGVLNTKHLVFRTFNASALINSISFTTSLAIIKSICYVIWTVHLSNGLKLYPYDISLVPFF